MVIKESLQKYLEIDREGNTNIKWESSANLGREGNTIGTKGTRIGNKGAQTGNKETPNRRQTSTLTKIRKTLTSTKIL